MKHFMLMLLFALCALTASAQSKSVSGTVRDVNGNPLPGVAIVIPGTTAGTVTDFDGRYTIKYDGDVQTLNASFIGMKDGIINVAAGQTDIVLEDDSQDMEEVVVVAYGTSTRQAFTGSVAVVGADDLEKRTASNVANTLAGQVPGLQMRGGSGDPGSSAGSIKIRGISSLYADTDPLVIVDGAPYESSLNNIPAEEIESVTVLKDAASAALYGARGAAGVIIITTKKGGAASSEINVEAKWGVNSRSVKDYEVITNPGEYYEAYYSSLYNRYYYGDGLSSGDAYDKANKNTLSHLAYQVYTVPDGENLIGMDGKLNSKATLGYQYVGTDGEIYYALPDDWTDETYNNCLRQEYTISARSGSDRGSFFTSLNYLDDKGIIVDTGFRRFSARINADHKIKDWLKVGANVGYTNSRTKNNANMEYSGDGESSSPALSESNVMYFASCIAPIYPVYVRTIDDNGNIVKKIDENGNTAYDFGRGEFAVEKGGNNLTFNRSSSFLQGNPLGNNKYNTVTTDVNNLNAKLQATVFFPKNIKLDVNSSINFVVTQYSDYENSLYGSRASVGGTLEKYTEIGLRQNHVQTLNWVNTFADVHNVSVTLGHEWYDRTTKYLSSSAQGSFSEDIKEIDAFAKITDGSSYKTEYNVEGYFGTVQYNYFEKYYLSASYRRDASSKFYKDNQWGDFWSVGAAWIMSKERFMENTNDFLDELKIKVSVGQQGNDNIGSFAYTDLYSLSSSSETTVSPSFYRMGNEDITWETTTNTNIGAEFSFFKRRLFGSLDWYYKKTTDLLFSISIPESAGSRAYYGNIGDIRNSGVELTLTGSVIRTSDMDLSLTANIAHNSTEILKLPESKTRDNGGFYEYSLWYEEGGELYNYMTYSYAGVDEQGRALYWYDEDLSPLGNASTNNIAKPGKKRSGKTTDPTKASRYTKGSILPKFYGGFGLNFTWRGLDASAQFDYQIGGKIYDDRYAYLMSPAASTSNDPGQNYHKDWKRSWSPNNTSSDIPRWQFGDQYSTYASDRFLTNASYLNFSSFVVGYTLPYELTKKAMMSKVRFFVAGENITFWSARQGLDPRYSYKTTETVSNYSPARTISGGIQLAF